ncbi:hypothetical protein Tco_1430420 [Tanacetum coccineum]
MLAPKGPTFNEELVDQAWEKHSHNHFRATTALDMEVLIKTCLMPLAIKTQNDSFAFVHELKQEMHANLQYVESLEKEIDELESNKAEFSNMYDILLQECVSNDIMCSYLHSLSDLDAHAELQCLYVHKVKECECSNDMVHNYYLEEAKKKAQFQNEKTLNTKPRVQQSARSPNTANGNKTKPRNFNQQPRNWPPSMSSHVSNRTVNTAEPPRNQKSFLNSKDLACPTCKKCIYSANHDECILKYHSKIPIGQKFSSNKSSNVYLKTTTPRSGLTWKPTGRIFTQVGLKWIPVSIETRYNTNDKREQYFEIQDLKAQLQDKDIAISELKKLIEKNKGKGVDTNFEKQSILGKPPLQPIRNQPVVRQPTAYKSKQAQFPIHRIASQVGVSHDLTKPVTPHSWPQVRKSSFAKPYDVNAPGPSRNSPKHVSFQSPRESVGSNDMVHNYYLEEAKKKAQLQKDKALNTKPSVQQSARLPNTANGNKSTPRNFN